MSAVAVVTGAASGIGRATALRLARDGYEIAMMDLDDAGLAETATLIGEVGGLARPFTVDLCDPLAVGSVTREIAVTVGAPEVLVNVAGIGLAATVLETSDADWNRVMAVNLTGPFLTIRATLPLMLDRGSGVIVNIASVGGQVGLAGRAAYCASKAGLVGLTRAVAVDHAREGIRCVAVCPGTVETEWIGKILSNAPDPVAARAAMAARQLDGRMGSPEEVAAMVAFLAGPEGRFVNGAALVLDGGMTAA
ncbi:NAD(P)-dependent dehydrogenase, short-chain alcohol dehydrogenase family [Streptosporangium subroseum]|uniref:NAD(P)-dependent dehydrogenase, short-chain alcohol dehydrogenase family n=1 Tax=Streptosporangium subroseum TaxID=106412 RepID=A0A239J5T9_9ACTN|nr:SDR family oxidoreductase [Streptosporangium subroseum]SNT00623.1 NAD(P)-dependent dehydrogenase, short-chain alcohol dehydrogenase family [Streptosporangium subroseum]